ncbi:HPr family phosphocarrier protein [[Clostridium] polysaccharolyticum]|uniref:Phosphocarrier protein n=1 Tax=[Clostridium] polysaccharolyticum TaxID=29364 RepID=A0A1H9ZD77_9FIRM|nr:HPr family phosphocarrier protein [[Clostridium] polysaccharolyticum]SES79444.1 phosphocarrier protein [[Clostridium] polysaccharolyticum]
MVSAEMILPNPNGLHLRPAGRFCTEALKYTSSITIQCGENRVNGKSVLGVLAIGLRYKSHFQIICEGEDEEEALAALKELVEQGLGEPLLDSVKGR